MPRFNDDKALVSFVKTASLPEWQRKLFAKYRKDIITHSQGLLFHKIDRLFPHEAPESKEHRLIAFEAITEASFMKAASNVNWVFQNSSYKVTCGERTLEFLRTAEIHDKSVYDYILDEWCKIALTEDANALMVIYPFEYAEEHKINQVSFVMSENITYHQDGIIIFKCEDESEVKYELRNISMGKVFYDEKAIGGINVTIPDSTFNTFTPIVEPTYVRTCYNIFIEGEGLYRINQLKDDKGNVIDKYEIEEFPMDFTPVYRVGGEKIGKMNVYKSFLHPFVAFGNLALLHHSQHIATNLMFAFPRMDEVEIECDADGCISGRVSCEVSEKYPSGVMPCPSCGGRGAIVPQTPYKIYRRKLTSDAVEGTDKSLEVDSVKFYTPPTDILKYSKQEWQDYIERAESAVYISQKVKTGGVESAESKQVDAEDKYTFNNRVGRRLYDVMRFAIQCYENYITPSNPVNVVVEAPKSLAILSEDEAFAMLNTIMSSNVPVYVKASQIDNFMHKFISQTSPIRKFYDALKVIDILLFYTSTEIMLMKSNMVVSTEQWMVHAFAYSVLQKMFIEDKSILEQDVDQLKEKVLAEIELIKPEEPTPELRDKFIDK